ncbi:MAG: carboxypeptidase regulatory-like domain-containing protein [Planctomycetes bacterium]|nr:carboxypeptidase regulatory-like domain-containing protein [Planctomycetota bacterium]
MRRLAVVVTAVLAALTGWWLWGAESREPRGPVESARDVGTPDARPLHRDAAIGADSSPRTVPQRTGVVEAAAERGRGVLRVFVRSRDDRAPLPHVVVVGIARDGRDEQATRRVVVTGFDGMAQLDALDAGPWHIALDRGPETDVVIDADRVTEIALAVPPGVDALVRVLDAAGARVPGADVLMWPADGILDIPTLEPGVVVGRTDASGELRATALPHLGGHGAWFAAHHDALGTSDVRMVRPPREPGEESSRVVELRLGTSAGAGIDLRVTDPAGRALAGVLVSVRPLDAPSSTEVDGERVLRHRAHAATTDVHGRTSFGPLPAAEYVLRASTPGRIPYHEFLTIGGSERLARDVVLEPSARVRGSVTADDGRPIGGARVVVQIAELGSDTFTGEDGAFVVDHLSAGTASWTATHPVHAEASGAVVLRTGEDAELHVRMAALPRLCGRVVDAAGGGLQGWTVIATADLPGYQDDVLSLETAADGAFSTPARADVTWAIAVREPGQRLPYPIPELASVRPGDEPLLIRIPDDARATAFVTGLVVDGADRPALAGMHLSMQGATVARAWFGRATDSPDADRDTGRFRLGPMPPGRYTLWVSSEDGFEFPVPDVVLAPRTTTELGRVVVPATGTLAVAVDIAPGCTPADVAVQIDAAGSSDIVRVDPATWTARRPCLPGSYDVTVYGTGFRWVRERVRIVAGDTETIRATLRPAVRVALRFHMPPGENGASFVVRDARGETAFDLELDAGLEFEEQWPFLDVGTFDVEATGASGRRYRFRFPVDSLERSEDRIDVCVEAVR